MRAQAAVDYFTIVSVALLILIPLILYINQLLTGYRDDIRVSLAEDTVNKLGESVDWVYSQGPPAKLTLENIFIPEGIEETSLDNNMILFRIKTSAGIPDVYYETVPSLDGSIPSKSGYYQISLTAYENNVTINVI